MVNSWQETEASSLKPRISIPIKSTIESIDEVVTVPAGTFKECLKIRTIGVAEKFFEKENLTVRIEVDGSAWFAPGVGLIKVIFKEEKTNPGVVSSGVDFGEIIYQLETFK